VGKAAVSECPGDAELQAALEGRLSPDTPAGRHIASCRTCQTVVAFARSGVGLEESRRAAAPRRSPEAPTLVRGQAVDRYLVLDRLGAGAMGTVYAAYDTELDRRVAVKLLHPAEVAPGASGESERAALRASMRAEAQAMARLAHPNVIRVYDVGEHEGALFLAMELVEGTTLAAWLAARRRSWREVLQVFRAAGAGLAAAHEAGIIHRDFKPANVLVRDDGQVFVTDFGLARAVAARHPRRTGADVPVVERAAASTRHDMIVGTPGYMAPEVLLGEIADERSDLFSFAVSLHEGLYGALPFTRRTIEQARAALLRGELASPTGAVPRWVRRELARALDPDPGARHASQRALNDALGRDPMRRWRRVALAAAALGVVLVGAALFTREGPDAKASCMSAGSEVDAVWNDAARARVHARFGESGRPVAEDAFAIVARGLDAWKATYASMQRDVCVNTLQKTQTETLLARRAACLQKRRFEAAAVLDLLVRADGRLVERAREVVESLDALEACGDFAALSSQVPLPSDAQRVALEAVDADLARAVVAGVAGRSEEGLRAAAKALELARASGYAPRVAESRFEIGRLHSLAGAFDEAHAELREATWGALAVHDDQLAAKAALQIAYIWGNQQARFGEAREALGLASALIARMGGDVSLEATLHNTRGQVLYKQGAYREAVAEYRHALELRRQAGKSRWLSDERRVTGAETTIRNNLANALAASGSFEEALSEHAAVLETRLATEGPSHPSVASTLNNLGFTLMEQFRYREALEAFERAVAVRERVLAPEHWLTGMSRANAGMALAGLGRNEEAIEQLERGLAAIEKKTGRAHPNVAAVETELAAVHLARGDGGEAEAAIARAIAALDASVGREHADAARTHEVHGQLLLARGDVGGALVAFTTAVAITGQAKPDTPAQVGPLVGTGESLLALGEVGAAIATLEEARARMRYVDPVTDGDGAFALARALAMTDDEAPIDALVARAREAYRRAGVRGVRRATTLEAWFEGERARHNP